jgi:phage terminase large subunit
MPYYTEIFLKNFESKTSIVLNEGGARSSKSHSMCQLFIYKMLNEKNKSFLITRKTLPALRITAYKMFFDILMKMNLYDVKHHNKTQRTYTYNSNYFLFTSLDHPVKIQSTEFNYIWMEEAEEFTFDDFVVLKTRLSSPSEDGKRNQMFLTYNPKNESSYINKKVRFFEDVTLIKSTYKSNPFISEDYIKIIESLKDQDNKLYQIYALGEYACIEGQIFIHIRSANHYPSAFDEVFYGLDFGYNNPSCLVKIGVKDEVFYLTELFYLQKLTTLDIINLLAKHKVEHYEEIYADPSSPEKINEIQSQGFNIIPADNNVLDGINFLKSQKIYTRKSNTNINNEINEYVWRKDKNGNYIDIPVKYNDHSMDAIRYAIYSHCKNRNPVNIRIIRHHF